MAGNNRKNTIREVFYVLAVLVLIAALGGLYYLHTRQNRQQEEVLETIIASEQSPEINNAKLLSDAIEEEESAQEVLPESEEQTLPEKESPAEEQKTADASEAPAGEQKTAGTQEAPAEAGQQPQPAATEEQQVNTQAGAAKEQQAETQPAAAETQQAETQPAAASENGKWEAAMPVAAGSGETAQSAQSAEAAQASQNVVPEQTAQNTEAAQDPTVSQSADASQNAAGQQEQIVIVDEPAQESTDASGIQHSNIMILNGTYKNGVAAYWQGKLKEEGYDNLYTASYSGKAEQTTYIYTNNPEQAQALKEFFPNAEIREGDLPAAFTMSNGTTKPDSCDYYVVVGIADGVTQ